MHNDKRKKFRIKVFVSFTLALSFVMSSVSGVLLYLRPEGSLAAWTGWSILGLDKKQWEGMHSVSVLIFLLSSIFHIVYNWKVFVSYFRNKKKGRIFADFFSSVREFSAAVLLVGIIFSGFLTGWSPFQWITNLRSEFKDGFPSVAVQPPAPDADKMTMAEISALLGVQKDRFLDAVFRSGIRMEGLEQTLTDVSLKNNLTPEEIFSRLKTKLAQPLP